jgi:hypothetical protein
MRNSERVRELEPVSKPMRFSQLSSGRQALVRLAQRTNYGQIQSLPVRGGDPVLGPDLVVHVDIKLGSDGGWRPEVGLTDFNLPKEICALMRKLDEIQDGEIEAVHIQAGVPHRIILRCRLGDAQR